MFHLEVFYTTAKAKTCTKRSVSPSLCLSFARITKEIQWMDLCEMHIEWLAMQLSGIVGGFSVALLEQLLQHNLANKI